MTAEDRPGQPPLVSIVIPCYNQARFLSQAIESALAQTHRPFEILVIDDGSPDETAEIAGRYPDVRCIRQPNRGLSAARNTGIRESRGKYLVFLDADDRLLPDALQAGVRELNAHPDCAFAAGNLRLIAEDGSPLPTPPRPIAEPPRNSAASDATWTTCHDEAKAACHVSHNAESHYARLLERNFIWGPLTVMYRREVLDRLGGFETSLRACEDYEMYLRIARSFPVHCHDEIVGEYRRHGTSMSRQPARMLRSAQAVLRAQIPHVRSNPAYRKSWERGLEYYRDFYGAPLAAEIAAHARAGAWGAAASRMWTLLRYHPQGFFRQARRTLRSAIRGSRS